MTKSTIALKEYLDKLDLTTDQDFFARSSADVEPKK